MMTSGPRVDRRPLRTVARESELLGHDALADDRPPHWQGAQRDPRVLRR